MVNQIEKNSTQVSNDVNTFSNWMPGIAPLKLHDTYLKLIDYRYFYVTLSIAIFLLLSSLLLLFLLMLNRQSKRHPYDKSCSKNEIFRVKSQSLPATRRNSLNDFNADLRDSQDIALYQSILRNQLLSHSKKRKYNSLSKVHGREWKSNVAQDDNSKSSFLKPSYCRYLLCKNMIIQTTVMETNNHENINENNGIIQFSMEHDMQQGLMVHILRCHHVPPCSQFENWFELRNVFVQIIILPDEVCHQTRLITNQSESDFNHLAIFKLNSDTIMNKRLRFSIYYLDQRQTRHSLGHALIDLKNAQLQCKKVYELPLHSFHKIPKKVVNAQLGELEILLKHADTETLTIGILNYRNHSTDIDVEESNQIVFVRVEFCYARSVIAVEETGSIILNRNVSIDKKFQFKLPTSQLNLSNLIITIHKISKLDSISLPLGKIEIGAFLFARGESLKHWEMMLKLVGQDVTQWHHINLFDAE